MISITSCEVKRDLVTVFQIDCSIRLSDLQQLAGMALHSVSNFRIVTISSAAIRRAAATVEGLDIS